MRSGIAPTDTIHGEERDDNVSLVFCFRRSLIRRLHEMPHRLVTKKP